MQVTEIKFFYSIATFKQKCKKPHQFKSSADWMRFYSINQVCLFYCCYLACVMSSDSIVSFILCSFMWSISVIWEFC